MGREPDKWSSWLIWRRYANNKQLASQSLSRLEKIRDKIISNGAISEGDTVIDIGTGDGFIGIHALPAVGESGKVYFTDISEDVLELCKSVLLNNENTYDRCHFVRQSADSLDTFSDNSIDVITGRAVLMYIEDKEKCFKEFFRVLKPGGKLSLYEPINQFSAKRNPNFLGLDFSELDVTLASKIMRAFRYPHDFNNDPMLSFTEEDLFIFADNAGFEEIKIEFQAIRTSKVARRSWSDFLNSSPNPIDPSMQELLNSFDEKEKQQAIKFLQKAWEGSLRPGYNAEVYVVADK